MKNKSLLVKLEQKRDPRYQDLTKQCTEYQLKNQLKYSKAYEKSDSERRHVDKYTKRLLTYLFTGTRGGANRLRIVLSLAENSLNTHQLAKDLNLDYKSILHHVRILEKDNIITRIGEGYGATFRLSTFLEVNIEAFNEIITNIIKISSK